MQGRVYGESLLGCLSMCLMKMGISVNGHEMEVRVRVGKMEVRVREEMIGALKVLKGMGDKTEVLANKLLQILL